MLGEFPNILGNIHIHRGILAKLPLLRAALDPALNLEDPFGGRILRGPSTVWSGGSDGVDDGGQVGHDLVLMIP